MLAMNPQMRLLDKAKLEQDKAGDVISKTKKDKLKESKTTSKKPKDKKSLVGSNFEEKAEDRIMTPNFMAVFHKKELILKRSMFNTVCYGVPDLLVKTGKWFATDFHGLLHFNFFFIDYKMMLL